MNRCIVLILAFALVFSLSGCSFKKAITADEFEEIMEDEDFDVKEGMSDYLATSDWEIDEARYASQDDFYLGFIFVVFDSEDDYEKTAIKGEFFKGSEGYTVIVRIENTVLHSTWLTPPQPRLTVG